MGHWFVLGLLLAGCGVGALLTAAGYVPLLRKVKNDLQVVSPGSQSKSQTLQDPKDSGSHRRSA